MFLTLTTIIEKNHITNYTGKLSIINKIFLPNEQVALRDAIY